MEQAPFSLDAFEAIKPHLATTSQWSFQQVQDRAYYIFRLCEEWQIVTRHARTNMESRASAIDLTRWRAGVNGRFDIFLHFNGEDEIHRIRIMWLGNYNGDDHTLFSSFPMIRERDGSMIVLKFLMLGRDEPELQ